MLARLQFLDIDDDALLLILKRLSLRDICSVSRVNKHLYSLANAGCVWQWLCCTRGWMPGRHVENWKYYYLSTSPEIRFEMRLLVSLELPLARCMTRMRQLLNASADPHLRHYTTSFPRLASPGVELLYEVLSRHCIRHTPGHSDMVSLLSQYSHDCGWSVSPQAGRTALMIAVEYSCRSCVSILLGFQSARQCWLDLRNHNNETVLHRACNMDKDPVIVGMLLRAGADCSVTGPLEETPLHIATRCNPEAALQLLHAGADVHARDKLEQTALHIAASSNQSTLVHELLLRGASKKAKDKFGRIPAMRVMCPPGESCALKELLAPET